MASAGGGEGPAAAGRAGWLDKKGKKLLQGWQRRWFALDAGAGPAGAGPGPPGPALRYGADAEEVASGSARGTIAVAAMRGCECWGSTLSLTVAEAPGERVYELRAASEVRRRRRAPPGRTARG